MYVVYYLEVGHYMDPDFHAEGESFTVETEEEAVAAVEDLTRKGHRGVSYEAV